MFVLSLSYRNAPVEVREKIAFSVEEQMLFAKRAVKEQKVDGCVVVSTCNRVEIYISGDENAFDSLKEIVSTYVGEAFLTYQKYFRRYQGKRAILHLFRVVAGMDSMVVGEDEILGQVRDAYQRSLEYKLTDYHLNTIFQSAFTCAKRIKTETMLSKTSVSIATLVANTVMHFPKEDKNVLLIGMTGKMGNLICKNILSKEHVMVYGTIRQHNDQIQVLTKEEHLVQIPYQDRYHYIEEADIVISVTTSPHYTILAQETRQAIKTAKTRLFIDLAVPRDMDMGITDIEGITLMDIDHFEELARQNNAMKQHEAQVACEMIDAGVDEVMRELCFHTFLPKVDHFCQYMDQKKPEQLLFALRDHANYEECQAILRVLERMMEDRT